MTNCTGPYATVEDYISFTCRQSRLARVHDGADNAASLTDTMARFNTQGVTAGQGMILYNVTDGSQGYVTAVSADNLVAPLTGGTENLWDIGDSYLIVTIDAFERATIQNYLDITAADVQAAVAAGGQCNCTLADWGAALLQKLNIVDAMSLYTCPCHNVLNETERQQLRNWMDDKLEQIRTGKIDLCGGSGSEQPAFGSIKMAVTPFAAREIIIDRILQGRGV